MPPPADNVPSRPSRSLTPDHFRNRNSATIPWSPPSAALASTIHNLALHSRRPSRDYGLWTRERSEEHTSELQSPDHLVCRLLLEKKKLYHEQIYRRHGLRDAM